MGRAIFLDGVRPVRREARVDIAGGALVVRDASDAELARWPLAEVRRDPPSADGRTFLHHGPRGPGPERLLIEDADTRLSIVEACPHLDRAARWSGREIGRVAVLALVGILTIGTLVGVGVPFAADRLAPLVPARVEANLGRIAEAQVRVLLRPTGGRFECEGAEGRAALAALTARLTAGEAYAIPPRIAVVDIGVLNAIALPGGQIYLFRGLLRRAREPDEVVGVLAHELGHVRARHGMRALLATGSTSFLVGLFLGDFAGAGAVALVTRSLLSAGYSREAEREADDFAVDVMLRHGGDARALGRALARITRDLGAESGPSYFDSHPFTPDRIAAIEARLAGRSAAAPAMSEEAWQALRAICD